MLLIGSGDHWSEKYYKTVDKRFAEFYTEGSISELPSHWDDHTVHHQVSYNGKITGHVILAQAYGKYDYFDFLIFYDSEARIQYVEVLDYREEYGFEISSKRWLRQFIGLGKDPIEFNQDVQGISGATLSSRSITKKIDEITTKLKSGS